MTELLTNFHFLRPAWLLLLPVAVVLWWLWRRCVDPLRGWREQIEPDLLKWLAVGERSSPSASARWLPAGWFLATVAVAGPTWRLEPNPFAEDAPPLIVLLKADISMNRPDPLPSRLERAKLKIADLAAAHHGRPLGLIAYSGSAHLVLPPTRDTAVVAEMAAEISPEIMPEPGDRLDLALRKAIEILSATEAGGSVLVIADAVEGDLRAAAAEHSAAGRFPLRFLALTDPDTPDAETIREAARSLRATVQQLTLDNADVVALSRAATSRSAAGISGESSRWQEAGYWLVPLIALIVAVSFRRETFATTEGQG